MNNGNLKIPYGVSDFKTLRKEGLYFVDKSGYIRALELCGRFLFFVRPRRFGKSLFLNMLRCYYDLAEKDNFDALFGLGPWTLDERIAPPPPLLTFLKRVIDEGARYVINYLRCAE